MKTATQIASATTLTIEERVIAKEVVVFQFMHLHFYLHQTKTKETQTIQSG